MSLRRSESEDHIEMIEIEAKGEEVTEEVAVEETVEEVTLVVIDLIEVLMLESAKQIVSIGRRHMLLMVIAEWTKVFSR